MNSKSLQWLVLLLLVLGGIILLVQNSQPLGLVILNRSLPLQQLPLSFWVIFAVIVGIIFSVVMQLLMRTEVKGKPGDRLNQRLESIKERPKRQPENQTGRSDWERSRANYDWTDKDIEEKDEEAWNIESPPPQTTRPKAPKDGPSSRRNPTEKVRPQPQPERTRPTPDSPRRTTSRPPQKKNKNGVYDADYRVITPPYSIEDGMSQSNIDEPEEWI